jgi:hypothetical protein
MIGVTELCRFEFDQSRSVSFSLETLKLGYLFDGVNDGVNNGGVDESSFVVVIVNVLFVFG